MNTVEQFVLYNLLPALVTGAVAWAMIWAGIQLLGVRDGKLRLCLLTAPLVKSTLVLLGIGLVLPWPRDVFLAWHAGALPPTSVAPPFMVLSGLAVVTRSFLAKRARRLALQDSFDAGVTAPRVVAALDRVMGSFDRRRADITSSCGYDPKITRPRVRVTERDLHSPLIVTDQDPTIVFPTSLAERLTDHEIEGALAHEVAHLHLRHPLSCISSENVLALAAVNPLATIMSAQLRREEEMACDDMAVAAVGGAEIYAGMLLKSYRFATESTAPMAASLQFVPQLLGFKPMLSERVERLLGEIGPGAGMARQHLAFVALWAGIITVFLST